VSTETWRAQLERVNRRRKRNDDRTHLSPKTWVRRRILRRVPNGIDSWLV